MHQKKSTRSTDKASMPNMRTCDVIKVYISRFGLFMNHNNNIFLWDIRQGGGDIFFQVNNNLKVTILFSHKHIWSRRASATPSWETPPPENVKFHIILFKIRLFFAVFLMASLAQLTIKLFFHFKTTSFFPHVHLKGHIMLTFRFFSFFIRPLWCRWV